MLKKPITFENFDGEEKTEVHYFNMSKGELAKLELTAGEGKGFVDSLKTIARSGDPKKIIDTFEDLVQRSYGLRSEDGNHFYKNDEIKRQFVATAAYDALVLELCTDTAAAVTFVNGVMPASLQSSDERVNNLLSMSPDALAAELAEELEKSPSQLARERSEAALSGHQSKQEEPKRVADPIVQPPAVPTQPQFQSPETPADQVVQLSQEEYERLLNTSKE